MAESKQRIAAVYLKEETMAFLLERSEKCFLCWWIHEDARMHVTLTGWPNDYFGSGIFPVEGKLKHLELEGVPPKSSLTPGKS
jgi:hypothetical protein